MFEKLGHLIVKRRKSAVILFIVGILVAGGVGSTVFNRLDSGGYSDPNSDSYKVYKYLTEDLKQSDPAVVIIVDSGATDVTDPVIAQKGIALEKKIAQEEGVTKTISYWTSGGEATLKSSDGKAAYILVYGDGEAFTPESQELGKRMQKNYDGPYDGLTLYAGGVGVVGHAITEKIFDLHIARSCIWCSCRFSNAINCGSCCDSGCLLCSLPLYLVYHCEYLRP
jgi:RND superfamily putative drug exporter